MVGGKCRELKTTLLHPLQQHRFTEHLLCATHASGHWRDQRPKLSPCPQETHILVGQLDPLKNKTQGHITVRRVVITAEKNTAGKAHMGIWRGVVQIQTVRKPSLAK